MFALQNHGGSREGVAEVRADAEETGRRLQSHSGETGATEVERGVVKERGKVRWR